MASEHDTHTSAHIVPLGVYVAVFVTLLVLTGVTTAISFIDLGPLNNVVAIGVAVIKAALVILFFMHVRYSSRLNGLVVITSLFWLFIMFAITLSDYLSRGRLGVPGK